MKLVCLLGATGSIGDSSLDVLMQQPDYFRLHSIAAHSNWKKALLIAQKFKVTRICMFDPEAAKALSSALGHPVLVGIEGLQELASEPEVDIVINERSAFWVFNFIVLEHMINHID